jgi:hypothetical protein
VESRLAVTALPAQDNVIRVKRWNTEGIQYVVSKLGTAELLCDENAARHKYI